MESVQAYLKWTLRCEAIWRTCEVGIASGYFLVPYLGAIEENGSHIVGMEANLERRLAETHGKAKGGPIFSRLTDRRRSEGARCGRSGAAADVLRSRDG